MKLFTDPWGRSRQYGYDGYDRLKSVKDPLNKNNETLIARAEFGNLLNLKRLDSQGNVLLETTQMIDPVGRMNQYAVKLPEGKEETYTYGYPDGVKAVMVTDYW